MRSGVKRKRDNAARRLAALLTAAEALLDAAVIVGGAATAELGLFADLDLAVAVFRRQREKGGNVDEITNRVRAGASGVRS